MFLIAAIITWIGIFFVKEAPSEYVTLALFSDWQYWVGVIIVGIGLMVAKHSGRST